jgi:uncharacterized membrane protein YphA (DoxX/SURF4 family)
VDRLYSRFPAGRVGLALLLLRLVAGFGLVGGAMHFFTAGGNSPEPESVVPVLGVLLVGGAVLLLLGLRTSLSGAAAAVCTIGAAAWDIRHASVVSSEMDARLVLYALAFALSGSLALLGPGGYSLDARLSGWRRITLLSGKEGAHVDR